MIKLIPIDKLRPGMYVHDLNCDWMEHNFVRNRFTVDTDETVAEIRALGVPEIWIDTERGLDVADESAQDENEVDEAVHALAAADAGTTPRRPPPARWSRPVACTARPT